MHLHWHKHIGDKGFYSYYECRCGSRKVRGGPDRGYSGWDRQWVEGKADDLNRKRTPSIRPGGLPPVQPKKVIIEVRINGRN